MKAEADCLRKATGPGCKRCVERKAGYSLVGLRRKTEKKAERAEERQQMLSLELVELVSQIATSMDLMERLVMGVDRIGKGLELVAERLGDRKEKEKERKNVEIQMEEMSEGEEMETESETDGEEAEEEKERKEWRRLEKEKRKRRMEKISIDKRLYFLGMNSLDSFC